LLREVAEAIRRSVRPSDLSARLGGDEFAVLFAELGEQEAVATLERLRATVNAADARATRVTASIGAVTFLTAPDDIETLLHRADALMYAAKAAGRNRVSFEVVSPVDTVAGARGPI
jgi:diguanylate cyclase (GGDEF)-like protein